VLLRRALVVPTALLSLALAGCSDGGDSSEPAAPESSAPTSSAPTVGESSTPSESVPSESVDPASLAPCTTDDLLPQLRPAEGGGTAGATHQVLSFVHEGSGPCKITGYPRLWYAAKRVRVGAESAPEPDTAPEQLVMQVGATVSADLTIADAGAYGDECQPTSVDQLVIVPSGTRKPIVMRVAATACANADVPLLTVGPLTAG
jgi:hypothetical protein